MYILGLQGGNHRTHDASACLIKDDKIIAFAEEERFIRQKRAFDKVPINATMFCLNKAGVKISDISNVLIGTSRDESREIDQKKYINEYLPKNIFGDYKDISIKVLNHHLCHAASSFYCSNYKKAGVLVIDGEGSGLATSIYKADNNGLQLLKSYPVNQSLGYLYASFSVFLGLGSFGAGKLMGLSSYGKPKYLKEVSSIFEAISKMPFVINQDSQEWYISEVIKIMDKIGFIKPELNTYFDDKRSIRKTEPVFKKEHKDIAASMQLFIEKKLIDLAKETTSLSGYDNLCMAGGVALNCVANSVMQRSLKLKNLFIQPACEDSGISLGAALFGLGKHVDYTLPCLGPVFSNEQIESILNDLKLSYVYIKNQSLVAAKLLSNNKVIGWFQGRMETGPRALGSRSILANPTVSGMSDIVNNCKGRELWRPFAPSILEENAKDVFEDYVSSPFMLKSFSVKKSWQKKLPAVVHVDGTSRPQSVSKKLNGVYYDMIKHFYEITGVPLVLNTSFNYAGEPIVCSPVDAIRTFYSSGLDALVIGNFLVTKENDYEQYLS